MNVHKLKQKLNYIHKSHNVIKINFIRNYIYL